MTPHFYFIFCYFARLDDRWWLHKGIWRNVRFSNQIWISAGGVNDQDWERSTDSPHNKRKRNDSKLRKLQIKIWKVNCDCVYASKFLGQVLSSILGSWAKASTNSKKEKRTIHFSIKMKEKKSAVKKWRGKCITLQHRKWRMQSKRKSWSMYKKITNQNPKKTKQRRNKQQRGTKSKISIGLKRKKNEHVWKKNPKRSKISCRASILNLTTTQRCWVYERTSESAQTNVLTRAHAYTAESYIYVQTEEFRLFSS